MKQLLYGYLTKTVNGFHLMKCLLAELTNYEFEITVVKVIVCENSMG